MILGVLYYNIPLSFGAEGLISPTPEMPRSHLFIRWPFEVNANDFGIESDMPKQVKMMGISFNILQHLMLARELFCD
ncbi:Uncharacterized protein TCM_006475 [Theobroma cacao]|uniref:Uncharacterized protein n=1 Tax=Theobroma cacao TaxID=3641 RepID=A0A061E5B4_THECC|nr:Uncharacterized protein TCM_006475 [Theobroma cacao]